MADLRWHQGSHRVALGESPFLKANDPKGQTQVKIDVSIYAPLPSGGGSNLPDFSNLSLVLYWRDINDAFMESLRFFPHLYFAPDGRMMTKPLPAGAKSACRPLYPVGMTLTPAQEGQLRSQIKAEILTCFLVRLWAALPDKMGAKGGGKIKLTASVPLHYKEFAFRGIDVDRWMEIWRGLLGLGLKDAEAFLCSLQPMVHEQDIKLDKTLLKLRMYPKYDITHFLSFKVRDSRLEIRPRINATVLGLDGVSAFVKVHPSRLKEILCAYLSVDETLKKKHGRDIRADGIELFNDYADDRDFYNTTGTTYWPPRWRNSFYMSYKTALEMWQHFEAPLTSWLSPVWLDA